MAFFTAEQVEYLSQRTVRLDFLVELQFTNGTAYIHNGDYDLTINGIVWKALHGIGTIDGISQTGQVVSEQVTFTLSGLPDQEPNLLSLALADSQSVNQQLAKVYIQLFDDDWQPVGSPIMIWFGWMQPPRVTRSTMEEFGNPVQQISVSAENPFYNRSRAPYGRLTDRDMQSRYPGDRFCQFVPNLINAVYTYPDY